MPEADIEIGLEGTALLTDPLLNKGMAFTEEERTAFALHGLLPPHVATLDEQIDRQIEAMRSYETALERHLFLCDVQDSNETLFYALFERNLKEMLPLVYTPTVGEACQQFSHYWRYPRGLFLSFPHRADFKSIFAHPRFDRVEVIVVSDGERILGLGDQGAGGMGIPIGKLSLYTACAGIDPATTLPILLDAGTDNKERLTDPLYVGWRHERVRGEDYDSFVEAFVEAVLARWPHVLLQWEDFARSNAGRILARYRDRLLTFNDDIQGTAAVAAGTLLAAVNVTRIPLTEQCIVVVGAGSAGCGISALLLREMIEAGLAEEEARAHFYAIDRDGLLVAGVDCLDFQKPFVRPRAAVSGWQCAEPNKITLLDVVKNAKPTVLIGVSAQGGLFGEEVVRAMAAGVARPVIFPLSNPTSQAEAVPQDLMAWTEGRAVIGTGSPFPPILRDGKPFTVDQTNNAYVFPGVGLGVLAVKATRMTDAMFGAAAGALADISPAKHDPRANLLPHVDELRTVAIAVARAVALAAREEGVCPAFSDTALDGLIAAKMWTPVYRPYRRQR